MKKKILIICIKFEDVFSSFSIIDSPSLDFKPVINFFDNLDQPGETLEIDNLSLYEVDHILPQSYTKDDSIDNKALVKKKRNQDKKNNLTLEDSIIDARIEWWKSISKVSPLYRHLPFCIIYKYIFSDNSLSF